MIEVLRLLHAQSSVLPVYHGSYYIRTLDSDEPLIDFGHGLPESPLLQRDWIWIAYNRFSDEPLGILAAAPCQGLAFLTRIWAIKSAPRSVCLSLLRKSLADMLSRGYTKYIVFLDSGETCASLERIALKTGGKNLGGGHSFICGPTNVRSW